MSVARITLLPFLCPALLKPRPAPQVHSAIRNRLRTQRHFKRIACYHSTARKLEEQIKRYGPANEPLPHLKEADKDVSESSITASENQTSKPEDEPIEEEEEEELPASTPPPSEQTIKASPTPVEEPTTPTPDPPSIPADHPLETVLHMPSPSESAMKTPHLQAPPYVHHFDTYGLVKRLEESGFSGDQSVTVMKAVRGLLTQNMGLATDGLVSKSHVENETYLFRAACSELRTEIQNGRKGEMEKMRTERTALQHEVDNLNQRFNQESGQLKDELKGLFDDRKMAVRMEQKKMENSIQELNYKITVKLNSDARSEVEGLRWVLTRRAASALAISAIMILATLRYSTYMSQTQEKERKEMEKLRAEENGNGNGGSNGGASITSRDDDMSPRRVAKEAGSDGLIVSEGGGRGYVSLG